MNRLASRLPAIVEQQQRTSASPLKTIDVYSTNSPKIINVGLQRLDSEQARLTIADNGSGMGSAGPRPDGLGTRLIGMLVRQLNGQLNIVDSADGYVAHVTFPLQAVLKWEPTS